MMTWGSDGDIRPFCALAGGLAARGHLVTLAVASVDNKDYSSLAQAMNFRVIPACSKFDYSPQEADEMILRIVRTRNLPTQFKLLMDGAFEPKVEEMLTSAIELCQGSDLIIGHVALHPLFTAAEKMGAPIIAVSPFPAFYRTKYASPEGTPNLGPWLNPLLWKLVEIGGHWMMGPYINRVRKLCGLPLSLGVMRDFWESDRLNLICASPSLCVRYPDWKDSVQIPGFFDVPDSAEKWELPDDLASFLDNGEPPVYFTFGSFTAFGIDANVRLMAGAAKLLGRRAIIQAFWENASYVPDIPGVYLVRKVPHHRIFPRCSLVVHHGGAGTTQSSLFCGRPSVVVAHAFDQFFWARRLHELGVGGEPLQKRTITAEKLASVIQNALGKREMWDKARELGEAMKRENGVSRAVDMIERRMGGK
jgi:UDP:flavonoid glycosyltransferase YjiC (YdhE family)